MNVEQIVGRATPEESKELLQAVINTLTEEDLYETLLAALTSDQIEELHAAMEQRKGASQHDCEDRCLLPDGHGGACDVIPRTE